jgi:Major tropism determinant N-terminal domain
MPLQIRRGLESDRTTIVPANGEMLYTTDNKALFVGDGATPGGNQVSGALDSDARTTAAAAFNKANSANTLAQSSYDKANSSNVIAQSAFDKANSANILAQSSYSFANSVNVKIDSAYTFANTVNTKTDAAFSKANSANVIAQAGFDFANTVNVKIDSAYTFANTINTKTDAAFTKANSANTLAQAAFDAANAAGSSVFTQASFDKANSANVIAQAAFDAANSAGSSAYTQSAFDKANSANVIAQSSYAFANTVNIKVDSAYAFSNTVNLKVDSAYAWSNTINVKVDSAYNFSNTVNIKVDSAYAFANAVNIKTDSAFDKANAANVLAQSAYDYANTISGGSAADGIARAQANAAFDKANAANVLAQSSYSFANTVNVKVDSVYAFANIANIKVDSAYAFANIANIKVDSAYAWANTINVKVDSAYAWANTINVKVDSVYNFSNTVNVKVDSAYAFANTANITAQAGFDKANAANILAQSAYAQANLDVTSLTVTTGVFGNASIVPVVTVLANGRVSSVTNTTIAISAAQITSGALPFAQGGTNASSYTTGALLTSNGTSIISLANTGTAGTYANAAYVPVITTDAYGRVSAVTNTAIAIDTAAITSGTIADARLPTKGTAGTYANATYVPVITTDAYGRVTGITNTAIAITSTSVTGVMTFAQGGANATTYTTGGLLTSNGTSFVSVANTGTAGTYANAAYIPVITTDAYGRVSSITNTAIAIDTGAITSGTIADARLPTKGTAGTYGNNAYHPVITTDAYGRVSAVTNTLVQIAASQVTSGVLPFTQGGSNNTTYTTGQFLTSNGTALVSVANTGTAGTYANAAYIPVITTDAYGRVSAVTNTAVAIDTSQLTSGTIADARLPTKGTAGTYANAAYIPVITTDAYGRVTGVTNTAVAITASQVSGGTLTGDLSITGNLTVSGTQTIVNTSTVSTNDSLLKLAANNVVGDVLDIGFYGQSNTGSSVTYHGLVRQAAGNFFLFKGLPTDPSTNTLATGSATAANTATLRANLTGGTVSSLASAIGIADGGTNQTSFTNGIVAYNGTALATLANTGTAGVYGNAAYIPVITTDAYGRVSSVTNTAIAIDTAAITSGTLADARLPTKGTAGTYANAAYVPVITTDAYGRVTGVTNTAIAIDTSAITSGTVADARLPTKGTAGVYGNAAYHPVITTDAYGRVTAVTNTLVQIAASQVTSGVLPFAQGGANNTTYTTGAILTSNGTAFVALSNTGTAGTYANAAYVPVITTDAYGRVSAVTNTLIQISTTQITSGALPFAQGGTNASSYTTGALLTSNGTSIISLANTATAGTYGNATYVPVITTDAYGRVTSVTNTAITGISGGSTNSFSTILVSGQPNVIANTSTSPLTLVAGSGISITTVGTSNTITFSSTGGFSGGTIPNQLIVSNTTSSNSNTTGAVIIAGGLGVTGNIYIGSNSVMGFSNTTNQSVVYQVYNAANNSLDVIFV